MRELATMSGTVDDLVLVVEVLPAMFRRSFQRLAARLADGTEAAKFKTASPLLETKTFEFEEPAMSRLLDCWSRAAIAPPWTLLVVAVGSIALRGMGMGTGTGMGDEGMRGWDTNV